MSLLINSIAIMVGKIQDFCRYLPLSETIIRFYNSRQRDIVYCNQNLNLTVLAT